MQNTTQRHDHATSSRIDAGIQPLDVRARRASRVPGPAVRRPELPAYLDRRISTRFRRRRIEEWKGLDFFPARGPRPGTVRLDSNDYLNLAGHPEITAARVSALESSCDPTLMSGAFLDRESPQRAFERAMADHMDTPDAILCQSGWAANLGLLHAIGAPDIPVYIDQLAHMSLREGAGRTSAEVVTFRHNDPRHLSRRIARSGPGIILVDSVYSAHGTVCPLQEFAKIAETSGCVLVVDESHSLGTHGPEGRGLVHALGLGGAVVFRTASLSKAFCARGGVIGCPDGFREYFRLDSPEAIFSSAVHSYEAIAFRATLDVIREADDRRTRLFANAASLRRGLVERGFDVGRSGSQILALPAGTEYQALRLRDLLAARGVVGAPFIAPATARRHALVRLTVHSQLTEDDLQRIFEACVTAREALTEELHFSAPLQNEVRTPLRERRSLCRARGAAGAGAVC